MTQEHVLLASEEQMTALLHRRTYTKKRNIQSSTGIRKEKISKAGSKAKMQENHPQGVHSNKVSRLCYKAEPGTLSHYMPSSS